MTNGEEQERHARVLAEALACPGAGPAGDSRSPVFGEWLRGIWASEKNPQRDGRYVRTIRRTGRVNRGTFYELTDGRGSFWEYCAESTVFIQPTPLQHPSTRPSSVDGGELALRLADLANTSTDLKGDLWKVIYELRGAGGAKGLDDAQQ